MGITVGAAMKKVAAAILTEPKVLKNILFAILVVLVALLLPMVMVVCLFSGRFQVDTAELQRHVEANLTAADVQLLRSVEDTMAEIEFAMIDAELSSEVGAAQALYIMALYDYSSQPGFVSRLVSCFGAEQTDDQLVANVNAAFGTDIVVQDFTNVMRNVRSRRIDTTLYVDCGTKNNLDLVQWAISAYQSRWGYVMGTFGQVLTADLLEAKLQQLPDAIGPYEDFIRANYLGVRTADCIGLIKGYSWYDTETGNINYGSNGMPDVSADQIYARATEKGSMSTMPEIPGLILHANGHVGVYIGNGYAIEAMGTKYGVVKTAVASRNWTGWCKNPYINYIEETEKVEGGMKINATFQGKQLAMEEEPCEVRKVISLPDKEYAFFKKHLMYEYDFLRKNKDQMGFHNGIRQCVLIMGESAEDGVLVDSSGYDYARYTAPFLGARSYMTLREQNLQVNGERKTLTADDLVILHAKHTLWVYGVGGEQADFSHCRIAGLSLGDMQFNGAIFRDTVLEDVDFGRAGICGADFTGARFAHCRMDGIAAEECNFRDAVFENCTLAQAHLAHSNLTGAAMKDCILCGADLRNCCVENLSLEDTELEDAYTQGAMKKEQDWEQSCGPCMTMG